jgi:hypothetical protein
MTLVNTSVTNNITYCNVKYDTLFEHNCTVMQCRTGRQGNLIEIVTVTLFIHGKIICQRQSNYVHELTCKKHVEQPGLHECFMLTWPRGFSFVKQEIRCLIQQTQPVHGNAITVMNSFRGIGLVKAIGEELSICFKIRLSCCLLVVTLSHKFGNKYGKNFVNGIVLIVLG